MIATAGTQQRTFLGHPIGLYVLFFTEMWERFSYYGMRALLILYMVNYLKMVPKEASTIYKVYTSFVYVTPILGGYLADRYLGNRKAVIIGAVLMAIGHFLMAFEEFPIFLSALIFLIFGNGFFKPNMSTQVGRLYPTNDGRRDGAYTIFYMGINLGAFLSPLVCGWLAENTVGSYHSGFTMAGIGMVLGLVIYLLGQPFIKEIATDQVAAPTAKAEVAPAAALTEEQAAREPSVLGGFSRIAPGVLVALGIVAGIAGPALHFTGRLDFWDMLMLIIGGGCLMLVAFVCGQVHGGVRDRVLAILMLGVFVIFFWAAFEQAGNVLNLWADQQTDRYLTQKAPTPGVIPAVSEEAPKSTDAKDAPAPEPTSFVDRFLRLFPNLVTLKADRRGGENTSFAESVSKSFNPVPTAWFQSINALGIFLIAPIFAWLWIWLDRRGWQPSIPLKMTLGLLLMSSAMVVMMGAANQENQQSTIAFKMSAMPAGIELTPKNQLAGKHEGVLQPFHAGRLTYDAASKQLVLDGVLAETDRDLLIQSTAPKSYRDKIEELQKESAKIDGKTKSVEVELKGLPPGFDMKYSGIRKSVVRVEGTKLITFQPLAEKEVKGLLSAAGEPTFRDTINELFVQSTTFRVSPLWLFWSYILATLGELCLSPVGLSMVSKLAPARFATMLMGVWMLTSAFGNFVAGALGEKLWGQLAPFEFFALSVIVVGGAALVLFVLCRLVVATMHGVK
jgi:POT family proton-dependent oligopeptide transporter